MLRETGGPPSYLPPKKRSLYEQLELARRISDARIFRPRSTWDEIAEAERIPKRTLQHFYRSFQSGLERETHPGLFSPDEDSLDQIDRNYGARAGLL
jgi:hypothetical protein